MRPWKTTLGVAILGGLLSIGALTSQAFAQTGGTTATPSTTPAAGSAGTAQPGTNQSASPVAPDGSGGPHGFGPGGPVGRGGHNGPSGFGGPGGPGGATTEAGATRVISDATSTITLVQSDLTYATGKMDTGTVQNWLNGANALVKTAQTASSNSQYEAASADARAAEDLAQAADSLMAQALGAANLPSASQRPTRPAPPNGSSNGSTTTPTQAQVSRQLAHVYNDLLAQGVQLKSAGVSGDASTYLTAAQDAYKTAYTVYQAGKYSDAAAAARTAEQLSRVVDDLLRAATAGISPDSPVTVPAPNF